VDIEHVGVEVVESGVVDHRPRGVEPAGQADELGIDLPLRLEAVIHELDIEIPRPEDLGIAFGRPKSRLLPALTEEIGDLAAQAGGKPDQSLAVGGQELLVDPGTVIESLQVGLGQQDAEVLVAGLVLDQEQEMIVGRLAVAELAVTAAPRGDIGLAAENRLDAFVFGDSLELDRSEEVAVIGQGHGRHLVVDGGLDQGVQADGAVQDAVFRVVVKMDEAGGHGFIPIRSCRAACW